MSTESLIVGNATWDADVCFEDGFDLTAVETDDARLTSLYDKSVVSSKIPASTTIPLLT